MNLKQALIPAGNRLSALKDIDDPAFEAEVLLRQALQIDRTQLHLNLFKELSEQECRSFFELIERRRQGEPTAYITGHREFYGLDFKVDPRVLIPRPETELLVEEALKFAGNDYVNTIADIGCGSGAVVISLAVHLNKLRSPVPESKPPQIYAVDISAAALACARENARRHGVEQRIQFLPGDLLAALPEPVDLLTANLPYVKTAEVAAMPSAQYEPLAALDGGQDGLDQIRRLTAQLKGKLRPSGCAMLEVGLGQARIVAAMLQTVFTTAPVEVLPDLAGIERAVKIILPPAG